MSDSRNTFPQREKKCKTQRQLATFAVWHAPNCQEGQKAQQETIAGEMSLLGLPSPHCK